MAARRCPPQKPDRTAGLSMRIGPDRPNGANTQLRCPMGRLPRPQRRCQLHERLCLGRAPGLHRRPTVEPSHGPPVERRDVPEPFLRVPGRSRRLPAWQPGEGLVDSPPRGVRLLAHAAQDRQAVYSVWGGGALAVGSRAATGGHPTSFSHHHAGARDVSVHRVPVPQGDGTAEPHLSGLRSGQAPGPSAVGETGSPGDGCLTSATGMKAARAASSPRPRSAPGNAQRPPRRLREYRAERRRAPGTGRSAELSGVRDDVPVAAECGQHRVAALGARPQQKARANDPGTSAQATSMT